MQAADVVRDAERRRRATRDRTGRIRIGCITGPRKAKASVTSIEANAADALAALGALSASQPDLICLPEGFLYAGMRSSAASTVALDLSSPIVEQFAQLAKELHAYLAVPLIERSTHAIYNAVMLFDRAGAPIGTYRKRVLWPSTDAVDEFEHGVAPGDGGGPFPTEFGPIGIQICMEVHWPGPWRLRQREGLKLILFPSEQPGGMLLRHRAWQSRCFIVSAVSKGGPSQVIDPLGNVIAEWWPETPNGTIDIGLDFELVHFDHNEEKLTDLAREQRGRVEITTHRAERLCRVTSLDPAVDARTMLRAHDILPLDDYLAKVRATSDALRLASPGASPAADSLALDSISVIVPSAGWPMELTACIESLLAQTVDVPLEIVVVINGPDALAPPNEWPNVTVTHEPKRGPAAARNAGVRASSGDVLAFIDSDCLASPTWLAAALATMRSGAHGSIIGGAISRSGAERSWVSRYDARNYLQQERYVRESGAFVTANLVVHRSVFDRIGPFDETFDEAAYEDWDWSLRARRAGVPVLYDAGAVVDHPCMTQLRQLKRKTERLARGEILLREKLGRRTSASSLLATIRTQLRRARRDGQSAMDRARLMCVGAAAAVWGWRAARLARMPGRR